MKYSILIFLCTLFMLSCKENMNKNQDTKTAGKEGKRNSPEISPGSNVNKDILSGNWFIPHSAKVNIAFKNGHFEFNDYNLKEDKYEILNGTYKLMDSVLVLFYTDAKKQYFKFYKGTDGNYYIKGNGYYFVKADS